MQELDPIVKRIRKQNFLIGVTLGVLFIGFIVGMSLFDRSVRNENPEMKDVEAYLRNSTEIKSEYGELSKVEFGQYEISSSLTENNKEGYFDVVLTSKIQKGVKRITWEKVEGKAIQIKSTQNVEASSISDMLRDIRGLITGKKLQTENPNKI